MKKNRFSLCCGTVKINELYKAPENANTLFEFNDDNKRTTIARDGKSTTVSKNSEQQANMENNSWFVLRNDEGNPVAISEDENNLLLLAKHPQLEELLNNKPQDNNENTALLKGNPR